MSVVERKQAISLVNEAQTNGARKSKACALLNISVRTLERWSKVDGTIDKRHVATRQRPSHALTADEKDRILAIANSEKYRDLPPSKIVPLLADEGMYIASESTFYRIFREQKLLRHRQRSHPKTHHKPKAWIATRPNQVWSWDISYLPSAVRGMYYYLYLIMDIYSRKIVGWSIHDKQCQTHAAALMKQSCLDESVEKAQLVLHSDNGKPMKGMTMLAMLQSLGVLPSFSRPSVSDDNPFSESLFRTVKYHPTFPAMTRFETIQAARLWMENFACWYNDSHLHSAIKFVTPNQRHAGSDKFILAKRHKVYLEAKNRKPERWSGKTRNWSQPTAVSLNPDKASRKTPDENNFEYLEAA